MDTLNYNNTIDKEELDSFFTETSLILDFEPFYIQKDYKLFRSLIMDYNKKLNHILILRRKIDLIEFFSNFEKITNYYLQIFDNVNNIDAKKQIKDQIILWKKININNIKKYIKDN
jgi:hypothetical protein